jgi:hypothetical protein
MPKRTWGAMLIGAALVAGTPVLCAALSPCEYEPAESVFTSLSVQGNLQWFDDAYTDDRSSVLHTALSGDFSRFYQSQAFGYEVNAVGAFAWSLEQVDLHVSASGDTKWYIDALLFGIGAVEVSVGEEQGPVLDVTAGIGVGRFRDVTPLAQAIRAQDRLLDEGILLAPIGNEALSAIALAIAEPGLSAAEQLIDIETRLLNTGLLQEGTLGARGLLEVERVLNDPGEGRLCGWDVQGRVGLGLRADAPPSEVLVFTGNYAFVPDPISQWRGSVRCSSRLKTLSEPGIDLSLGYLRRLGDQWKVRVGYAYSRDQGWSAPDAVVDRHRVWAALAVQLSSRLSLRVDGELRYGSGDEEMTTTLFVHLDYDVL